MKKFVILLIALMFCFVNVNEGECKVLKTENVNIVGEPKMNYDEAARISFYELHVGNEIIIVGFNPWINDSLKMCLDKNKKVRLQGKLNTIEEKYNGKVVYHGRQFDSETVKCTPVK